MISNISKRIFVEIILIFCTAVSVYAAENLNSKVIEVGEAELTLVLGKNPSPAEKRAAELLAECIKDRTGISLAKSGEKAEVQIVIGTAATNNKIKMLTVNRGNIASPGADGYCIVVDTKKSKLFVAGQNESGVVAGVGRLMREMQYKRGALTVPELNICETPQMPNRGLYLWARKYYFDNPDQVDRYIEEFALWGCNAICFWFEMGMFNDFESTEKLKENSGYRNHKNTSPAPEYIDLYRRFYKTARRMGMKTGLLMVANDSYRTSPQEMRIQPIVGTPKCYLCPSKRGAVEKMLDWQEEVFKSLAPIDIFNIFPSDPGGCSCIACQPWPTQGFLKVAKPLAERIHKLSPETEIWIDTWHMNHKIFGAKDWQNMLARLAPKGEKPEWLTGFEVGVAPHHPFAHMNPEDRQFYNKIRMPLTVFPDISMWGNHKGMLVNKQYWKQLQAELNDYSPELMKGGWPYSERWNTDIASVTFLSWFWNSKKKRGQYP